MLREIVKTQIIENILRPQNFDSKLGHRKFSVLVLDKTAMRILNSCLALSEVFETGVTLVEDLTKNREPMPSMEAIYIISPSAETIQLLINDFLPKSKYTPRNTYKNANIYFLNPCDDDLFEKLSKSPAVKFIATLKEFNLNFTPLESQIFSVNSQNHVSRTASGIVSLCASLKINPILSAEICYRVDQRLKDMIKHQPMINDDNDAQLIILDRSFDLISPLLHETSLQSMATDLCDFKNGIYQYTSDRQHKKVTLDESDEIWMELRHKHIAEVLKRVSVITKETTKSARSLDESSSIRELGETIRGIPARQKKVDKLAAYINLADECRQKFFNDLEKVILLEQDMATGFTPQGEKLNDSKAIGRLSTLILPAIPIETRLRLILIFMLTIGKDKDEQFFNRLLHHTDIPENEYGVVKKMLRWRNQANSHPRRQRALCEEERFPSSRWDPKIRDVLQELVERRLDEKEFRFMGKRPETTGNQQIPTSARFRGTLPRDRKRKIIIFIVGGMTYSEMKTVYDMSEATNSTIYLGSDAVLTPDEFLNELRDDDD